MRIASTVLALTLVLAGAATAAAQSPTTTDDWRVTIYPVYGWVPVFGADITLPERPCDDCGGDGGVVLPGGHVSSNFNGAALAGVRVEKGRWLIEGQGLWAGMEGVVDRPYLSVKAGVIFGEALGGFALAPNLYVTGGVRRLALNVRAQAFTFEEVQWKPGFWEPVVGASYSPALTSRTRLFVHGDFGGEGNNKSAALTGRIEWQVIPHLSITAGYGLFYLSADGSLGRKPISFSQTLHGPIVGIGIPF